MIKVEHLSKKYGENEENMLSYLENCIKFIEEYNPEYVLILSGDHIYKMNYDKMLQYTNNCAQVFD